MAASSRLISRITPPTFCVASAITAPKPPKRTLVMERFMALHIRTERMKPEKPSGVGVQQRHHYGHVGRTDGDDQHDAEDKGDGQHGIEVRAGLGVVAKVAE